MGVSVGRGRIKGAWKSIMRKEGRKAEGSVRGIKGMEEEERIV